MSRVIVALVLCAGATFFTRSDTGAQADHVERPNIERPNVERPNVERPNVERLNVERPNVDSSSDDSSSDGGTTNQSVDDLFDGRDDSYLQTVPIFAKANMMR
jgi:hypothetical protein